LIVEAVLPGCQQGRKPPKRIVEKDRQWKLRTMPQWRGRTGRIALFNLLPAPIICPFSGAPVLQRKRRINVGIR